MNNSNWKCKKCGAEMDNREYNVWKNAEDDETFIRWQRLFDEPLHGDCGCTEEDEGLGETLCNCEFEKSSERDRERDINGGNKNESRRG